MQYLDQVEEYANRLRTIFPETPLLRNQYLSDLYEADVYLKREDLTPVRSYKIRGAFTYISNFLDKNPDYEGEFVCASAGNHSQAFAYSCRHFKKKGTVFLPENTPAQKVNKTRSFAGDYVSLEFFGDTFDESNQKALEFAEARSAMMVPPFDHRDIIDGQSTVGYEIFKMLPQVDELLMPIGGGGLSAGLAEYYQEVSPETLLHFVEPVEADSLNQSLNRDKRVVLDAISSFVDGAAVKAKGRLNFDVIRALIKTPVQLVPEDRLCTSLLTLLDQEGIVLEPAGVLAIDAMKNFPDGYFKGKTVVCIASGGNFDFDRLPEVRERSVCFEGLKKYFLLKLPQRPRALREFLNECLDEDADITRFEYFKKSARTFGTVLLGLETTRQRGLDGLIAKAEEHGFSLTEITNDEVVSQFII